MSGEYNAVYKPNLSVHDIACRSTTCPKDVVIRMTRPDGGKTCKDEDFYRYKRLRNLIRELQFTLHAAVNGYGPPVYAAVIFPALATHGPTGTRHCTARCTSCAERART